MVSFFVPAEKQTNNLWKYNFFLGSPKMISKWCFWMIFNRYSRKEGERRAGEPGTESTGSRNYLRAESGSRNHKGTRLLFKKRVPSNFFFTSISCPPRRKIKCHKRENVIFFSGWKEPHNTVKIGRQSKFSSQQSAVSTVCTVCTVYSVFTVCSLRFSTSPVIYPTQSKLLAKLYIYKMSKQPVIDLVIKIYVDRIVLIISCKKYYVCKWPWDNNLRKLRLYVAYLATLSH